MTLKQHRDALYNWAEQDENNRAVLCICSEKSNVTEQGFDLDLSNTFNGKMGLLTASLVSSMKNDERLAEVISRAFIAYSIKHSEPSAVITVNRKEAEK